MRTRTLVGAGITALAALGLGLLLSRATTRVVNWFVMTDELYYERLAVSVAQTGSLVPRIHGEVVSNVNQLYPVLLSFVYGDGNVPASLHDAHLLNAFLIVSAALPVYLLARLVGLRPLTSVWVGVLAATVPWVVLASFLLTEVVAYPAFCWAVLAVTNAVLRRGAAADLLAVGAIGIAVLARVQFALLAVVLVLAVLWDALYEEGGLRRLPRARPVLAVLAAVGLVAVIAAAATGGASRLLGAYSVTARNVRVDLELAELVLEHLAVFVLGLAFVPYLLAAGWLVDRLGRSARARERAFALVGVPTVVLLTLQVASFDQRFGFGLVKDRYLFYVVPVLLVALAAAVDAGPWPRWWALAAPAVPVAAGFALYDVPRYEKLNVDSVLAMLNDGLVRLATSVGWARALLVLAVVVALQLLLLLPQVVPRRALALGVAAVLTVVLPLQAVYAFERLFRVDGTNGLPITLDQGVVFNWVDRHVGRDGRVVMIKYPMFSPDWWAGQAYWWDAEFWNESVVEVLDPPSDRWQHSFDRRTGAMAETGSARFALLSTNDVRFRLAHVRTVVEERAAYVHELERPWRADWVTEGIYADGWMRPRTPTTITIYAKPDHFGPVRRFLFLSLASPDKEEEWPVTITSNLERFEGEVEPEAALDHQITVCVPTGGATTVVIRTPFVASVYRDPTKAALTGEVDRPAGLQLRSVALADEAVPVQRCPPEPVVR